MKHSQGIMQPVVILDFILPKGDHIGVNNGTSQALAICGTVGAPLEEQSIADAKRISAAWNACNGITTELLEAGFIGKLLLSHKELLADTVQAYEDSGGCDHSVGICMCETAGLIDEGARIQAEIAGTFKPVPYLWPEEAENEILRETIGLLTVALENLANAAGGYSVLDRCKAIESARETIKIVRKGIGHEKGKAAQI